MNLSLVDKCIDINLRSLIHGSIHSIKYIKKSKLLYPFISCAIIQIASRASTERVYGFPKMSIYTSTKFGVRAFTNCMFEEIGDYGIKVSCIMPGMTNTEMPTHHTEHKDKFLYEKMVQPKDIAHAVNYVLTCPDTCCPVEMLVVPQYKYISKL